MNSHSTSVLQKLCGRVTSSANTRFAAGAGRAEEHGGPLIGAAAIDERVADGDLAVDEIAMPIAGVAELVELWDQRARHVREVLGSRAWHRTRAACRRSRRRTSSVASGAPVIALTLLRRNDRVGSLFRACRPAATS